MKLSNRCLLLSVFVLSVIFFWIFQFSTVLDSITKDPLQQQAGYHNQDGNSANRFIGVPDKNLTPYNHDINNKNLPMEPIDLPRKLSSKELRHWELFTEDGEENVVINEADYLEGEVAVPALTFRNRNFYLNNMR
ncbi:hypothetical protein EGW08_021846, partial [Elysia chlorotica]